YCENPIGVVRLDPALQKARRHRQMGAGVHDGFELQASEPARENVLAEFGAQPSLHAAPDLGRRLTIGHLTLVGGDGTGAIVLAAAMHECPLHEIPPPL